MITTRTKRKIIVTKILIADFERFKPIEIRLPANTKKITGVLVTASLKELPAP